MAMVGLALAWRWLVPDLMVLRDTLIRLIRYGVVGLTLNFAGYMLYLGLTWAGSGPKTTMTMLYAVGAIAGYFGHRKLAFSYNGRVLSSAVRYGIAHLCGYGLNFLLLYILVDRLGYPHQVIQAGSILIVAAFLFFCFNFLVFPKAEAIKMPVGETRPSRISIERDVQR